MDEFPKIDKGIPAPTDKVKYGRPVSPYGRKASEMEVGDSVFYYTWLDSERLRWALGHLGFKIIRRPVIEDGVSGWRVWKSQERTNAHKRLEASNAGSTGQAPKPRKKVAKK